MLHKIIKSYFKDNLKCLLMTFPIKEDYQDNLTFTGKIA